MILSSRALAAAGVMLSRSMFMALFSRAEMKGSQRNRTSPIHETSWTPPCFWGPRFSGAMRPAAFRLWWVCARLPVGLCVEAEGGRAAAILNRQRQLVISFICDAQPVEVEAPAHARARHGTDVELENPGQDKGRNAGCCHRPLVH